VTAGAEGATAAVGAPGRGAALLAAVGLSKSYPARGGPVQAVRDVSLAIAPAEVVALVGESGSGKSTTARLLALLERPSAGRVTFAGQDALRLHGRELLGYRRRVQMVFQDPFASLNPVRTVAHHLMRPMVLHGLGRDRRERVDRAAHLLETVGLVPAGEFLARLPHELSGGQRQRVAVARALAVGPDVILADEPVSMLDVSIRTGLLRLLERLRATQGLAYLYVTHDLATARQFADRMLVLYAGTVVEEGPAEAVVEDPAHPYTRLLVEAAPDPERLPGAGGAASGGAPPRAEASVGRGGCPFAPRCPLASALCRREPPPWAEVAAGHGARCHHPTGGAA
jgi:peptide/nickel transport system ATP-binding protein